MKKIPYTLSIKDENEKIQYIASITLMTLIKPIFILLLSGFFMIIFFNSIAHTQELNIFLFLLGPIFFLGSMIQFVKALIYILATEIVKTNTRVIFKTGLVIRDTIEIPLSQIESVNVTQSVFGRIFKYGTISIIGTGGTNQNIKDVAHIVKFRKALLV